MYSKALLPIVDFNSKILILGTFPSTKSLQQQQYYGNKQNKFWNIMFDLFQQSFTDNYSERIKLLQDNKIALWDVLYSCDRVGSLDSAIENEVVNDFNSFFDNYKNIELIVFSSVNAHKLYKKLVNNYYNKNVIFMPSTSGLYAAMSYQNKLDKWSMLLRFI